MTAREARAETATVTLGSAGAAALVDAAAAESLVSLPLLAGLGRELSLGGSATPSYVSLPLSALEAPPSTDSPFALSGQSEGGSTALSFSTSFSRIARFNEQADARRLAALGSRPALKSQHAALPLNVWLDGTYSAEGDATDAEQRTGHVSALYGADALLTTNFLLGLMGQYDAARLKSTGAAYALTGESEGWLIGPYAKLRLSEHWYVQGQVAAGTSRATVESLAGGSAVIDGSRWLASAGLDGTWQAGAWQLHPTARIGYGEASTDGIGDAAAELRAPLGQARIAPEISYTLRTAEGTTIQPHASLEAIWTFAGTGDGLSIDGITEDPEGLRGKSEVGVKTELPGGASLDLTGGYDGIGSSSVSEVRGSAKARVPLN